MVADVVECTWFMNYLWPLTMVIDIGTEFPAKFAEMILKDFCATKKVFTTKNPEANSIIEHVHQTMGT